MTTTNFKTSSTLDIEIVTNLEIELYDVGYSVEDSDVQVQLRFDKATQRVIADLAISIKVVSDSDHSKFITFVYNASAAPFMTPMSHAKMSARHVDNHNLDESEFESLFGGAIDELGYFAIKFESAED